MTEADAWVKFCERARSITAASSDNGGGFRGVIVTVMVVCTCRGGSSWRWEYSILIAPCGAVLLGINSDVHYPT